MKTTKAIAIGLLALLGVFIVSAVIWGASVAVSGPRGHGDATKAKNSSENWTAAQARFEDQHQAIISADEKIAIHKAALAADPKNPTLQTNLTGVTTGCISAVAEYNAESRKFLSEDFKSADLPYQIDKSDPATDCK